MSDTNRSDTYSKSAFLAIAGDLLDDFLDPRKYVSCDGRLIEWVRIDDAGVWVHKDSGVAWTPLCEFDGPGAKNPRDEPALRFPFSAEALAAFLIDGVGYFIRGAYGKWSDGPDQDALDRLGQQDRAAAAPALRAAYDAYRAAERVVGPPDITSDELLDELARKDTETDDEYESRAAALRQTIEGLHRRSALSKADLNSAEGEAAIEAIKSAQREEAASRVARAKWRKGMVQHLLAPARHQTVSAGGNTPKLTDADIKDITRRLAKGETQTALAKEYGVSRPTIAKCIPPKPAAGPWPSKKTVHRAK